MEGKEIQTKMKLFRRFIIYQGERFPFALNALYLSAFVFCAISYSRINRGEEVFIPISHFISAALTTVLMFFLLRIIDEYKDKEIDALHRPHLPVPRGLITLVELRMFAIVSVIILVITNVLLTPEMLPLLLIPLVFLLLIKQDFFISKFLKRYWPIYVLTHMFFYPAVDVYSSGMDWYLHGDKQAPLGMIYFFIVSYFNGLVFEVGRKIKAEDNEEYNSYTKMYGRVNALVIWFIIICLAFIVSLLASNQIGMGYLGAILLSLVFLSSLTYGILFWIHPNVRYSKLIELASGSWGLLMYLILGGLPLLVKYL